MGKSLNWGLLFCSVNFGERPFDSFSEFIREKSTERNYKVNDFGVHVREVKKRPQFFECQFLIIISDLFAFFLNDDQLEAVVNGVTLLPHQNLHSGFDWCKGNNRVGKFDALLNSRKPLRQFTDPFFGQVPLDLDDGHRTDLVSLFVALNIWNGLDKVAKSHKEGLKVLDDLQILILLIFLLSLLLPLVLNSLFWQLMFACLFEIFLVHFLHCLLVVSLDTVSACDQIVSKKNGVLEEDLFVGILFSQNSQTLADGFQSQSNVLKFLQSVLMFHQVDVTKICVLYGFIT